MTNVPESLAKQRSDLMERTRILQKSLDARSKRPVDHYESYERNFQARLQGILQRTKYDIDHHAPESLDWLNLMVAQTMHGYRESILHTSRGMPDRDTDLPLPSLATEEKAAAKRFVERLLNGAVEGRTMNVLVRHLYAHCRTPSLSLTSTLDSHTRPFPTPASVRLIISRVCDSRWTLTMWTASRWDWTPSSCSTFLNCVSARSRLHFVSGLSG